MEWEVCSLTIWTSENSLRLRLRKFLQWNFIVAIVAYTYTVSYIIKRTSIKKEYEKYIDELFFLLLFYVIPLFVGDITDWSVSLSEKQIKILKISLP